MSDEDYRRDTQPKVDSPLPIDLSAGQAGVTWFPPRQPERWPKSPPSTPATLGSLAQGCAGLFVVAFVGYTLWTDSAWTWLYMIGWSLCAALAGLIAGALLFLALRLLAVAARAAGALLVAGVVLDFLDVISIPSILAPMLRAIGF